MTAREAKSIDQIADALLVALSVLAVAGFWRLFAGWGFFWRLTAFAVASHAIGILGRRRGWSMAVVVAVSLVALTIVSAVALYWSTTTFGIPSFSTFDSMRMDLSRAFDDFNAVRPPAPVTRPLLLAAGLFVWWAALVADWAAFRLRFGFEALVPVGSVFIFGSLLGEPRAQVPLTGLFVLVALAFLLAHRVAHQQASVGWIGRAGSDGPGTLLRSGALVVVIAAFAATIAGPLLPGSNSKAIWNVRRGDAFGDGPSRSVVSPLIEIRKHLLEQSNEELFTVRADQRAYWRLTALDQFDGNSWQSNGSYSGAGGTLPSDIDRAGSTLGITQNITITALDTPWLPAAFEPKKVKSDAKVTWSSQLSTLIIGGASLSARGTNYTVESVYPIFDPAALEAAGTDLPEAVRRDDLALPADFSPQAAAQAAALTNGLSTSYDKALALQTWLRTTFSYDQTVTLDNSVSAIDEFLNSRKGYCQQFAGTFAAMARSIGTPARVAVGFTPGEPDASDAGLLHVKGTHAHAWPEVYIDGQGWVPFEPTPGRGIPNAEQYTHVPEEQSSGDGSSSTTLVPATTQVPATTVPSDAATAPSPRSIFPPISGRIEPEAPLWSRWYGRLGLAVLALLLLGGGYALGVPALNRHRRRARRAAATLPDQQVGVAWEEGVDAIALLGLVPARSETPVEFAGRVDQVAEHGRWERLAELLGAAEYADVSVGPDDAREALTIADGIEADVRATVSPKQRWLADLDPRPRDRRMAAGRRRGAGRRPRARRDAPAIEVIELPR
ncbi:MAG: transglutaminaseTgpA domain-containing protein [Acidimicrobiales bacterium]